MTSLRLAERVRKGIEFLNGNVLDWDRKVDPELLDLANCEKCVLGQLAKEIGLIKVSDLGDGDFIDFIGSFEISLAEAEEMGFERMTNSYWEYEKLTRMWRYVLTH